MKHLLQRAVRLAGYHVGRYPPVDSLAHHLQTVIEELAIDLVLDVGAHEGEFTESLRSIGYDGDIVSFEPAASSFAKLTKARQHDRRWRGYNVALGGEDGHRELNLYEGSVFNSFLAPAGSSRFEKQRIVGTETVAVRRLEGFLDDMLAARPSARIFLKIDTQGYDLIVLNGAGRWLPAIQALQTELAARQTYAGMPLLPAALTELARLGFDLTGVFPVARERDRLRIIELDCVMCRRAG